MTDKCHNACEEEFVLNANKFMPMIEQVLFNDKVEPSTSEEVKVLEATDEKTDLLNSLKRGIQVMRASEPSDFGKLVKNVVTNQKFDIQQTNMAGVENVLKKW